MRLFFSSLAALLCFILNGLALAVETEPYLLSYKAYSKALDRGDIDKAKTLIAEAYEQALASGKATNEERALLAHNYLDLTIWNEAKEVLGLARDAMAFAEAGHGLENRGVPQVALMLAFAEASAKPRRGRLLNALRTAVDAEAMDGPPTMFRLRATLVVTKFLIMQKRSDDAYVIATRLTEQLQGSDNISPRTLATFDLLRVMSLLSRRRPTINYGKVRKSFRDAILDSQVLAGQAIKRFEPQTDIASFDPILGIAAAWQGVIRSLAESYDVDLNPEHRFEGHPLEIVPAKIVGQRDDDACEVTWQQRDMEYPTAAIRRGLNGGVLIGFDLDETGRVDNAKILGEVPFPRFGPTVLESVKAWQADISPDMDEVCRKNMLTTIMFTHDL